MDCYVTADVGVVVVFVVKRKIADLIKLRWNFVSDVGQNNPQKYKIRV